jgi:aspartokinase
MASSATLGGFKVLKNVVRISLVSPTKGGGFPSLFCRAVSEARINLPYITCIHDGQAWRMTVVFDADRAPAMIDLTEKEFGKIFTVHPESVILSIFPHRNDPAITGALFEVLGQEGLETDAVANSPSAISVVLKEESLARASDALFGPFSFSAYRTPADWKLAQKGKEQLYKEVVASYQEKKPKVYGLNYRNSQEFLYVKLNTQDVKPFGTALKAFAQLGLDLAFLTTSSCNEKRKGNVFFCLPKSESHTYREILHRMVPDILIEDISSVGTFSMTGPHFGDRHGIATELLAALEKQGVDLVALNCTIASIRGVVPSEQIQPAIEGIKACFEVPTVTKKD